MSSLERSYFFAPAIVRKMVKARLGVYLLISKVDGAIIPVYVGRSGDLRKRLRDHEHADDADLFAFEYCEESMQAFHHECTLFHTYEESGYLLNEIHPACPPGSGAMCKICSFDGAEVTSISDLEEI
jgi:hypothetical protein